MAVGWAERVVMLSVGWRAEMMAESVAEMRVG